MIFIVLMIIFIIFFIITLSLLLYIMFSTSQKHLIVKKKEKANKERKQILSDTYREINQEKKLFNENCYLEHQKHEIAQKNIAEQEKVLNQLKTFYNQQKKQLDEKEIKLQKLKEKLILKQEELTTKLQNLSEFTQEEAKEEILKNVENKIQHEIISRIKKAENFANSRSKELSNDIILSAMEKFKTDIVNEKTTSVVKLENDDLKGWIIGKDGRNTKAFENYGGVEIIVDDTPKVVTVSCFNPIRREIATRTLYKLLKEKKIQPIRIEKELKIQEELLEENILEIGYQTVNELNILDMDKNLVKLLGRLKYRTSYGQNVLLHSVEVAKIASTIASELGLSAKTALRAGLLHDIGKALDFEREGSHVTLGVEQASKYGENEIVQNAIASHHNDVAKESEIAIIVSIADAISASRPGVRNDTIENFFVRMNQIEEIGQEIPGIAKTYAFQSGRQIRIIIDPIASNESEMFEILETFKNNLKDKVVIPGEITITAIREKREVVIIN
ncbi:ribonuclease Y [Mesoplasma corruscae]|uniref:Ribonuclease Y n=1 Tax=Mesoplasma corruscae TaxID=216874 RepID=A0A2S5RGP6_9MOLU|nr:ribonuclease Y [Mesoplasma corruscae]PPE06468.1 ribonuclease Y [Mesoplasma corruscae]